MNSFIMKNNFLINTNPWNIYFILKWFNQTTGWCSALCCKLFLGGSNLVFCNNFFVLSFALLTKLGLFFFYLLSTYHSMTQINLFVDVVQMISCVNYTTFMLELFRMLERSACKISHKKFVRLSIEYKVV